MHGEVEAGHMPPRRRKDDFNAAWSENDASPRENPIGNGDVVGTGTRCDDAIDGATRRLEKNLGTRPISTWKDGVGLRRQRGRLGG